MPTTSIKNRILAGNADQVWQWFQERGGIAVWKSVDFSTAGQTWTTPLKDADGNPMKKQNWRMGAAPSLVIPAPRGVGGDVPREIRGSRVAVKRGGRGLMLKCSDAVSRRIRR